MRNKKKRMDQTAVEIQWNQQTSQHVVLSSWSKLIQVYDVEIDSIIQSYDEHTAAKTYLDWNPKEPKQFVSGSNDCKIKIFSID
jgi:WD40 repeat protein